MDERALAQRPRKAQYQRTQSIYNADSIQVMEVMEFPITSSSTSCFHCWEENTQKHANKRPASCALRRFKVFGVGTHTVTRTRTRVRREGR